MAGKKIRSRNSQNSISVSSLSSRPANISSSTSSSCSSSPSASAATSASCNVAGGGSKSSKPTSEELVHMTKDQLKTECRRRGQKTTGNKVELLQRLGYKMPTGATKRKEPGLTANGNATVTPDDSRGPAGDQAEKQKKEKEKADRERIVLWKRPITTIEYSTKEVFALLSEYGVKILGHKKLVLVFVISALTPYFLINFNGPHQQLAQRVYKQLLWCAYWVGLGILSSVGLGTGLHTFLLYLGPFIAQVTLAAYECESLDFPEPPYPDDIICPDSKNPTAVNIFSIMSKVRLEAICWGAGTALGELPPYFMARAARLSGIDPDDEDDNLKEFEELQRKQSSHSELTLIERGKLFVEELVQKVGFLGILACASIPNPLFDLAGITCGHFLVPFWTFFGATLIGKAIIKMHLQKLVVIVAFNETLIETVLQWLQYVPVIGQKLQMPVKAILDSQKSKLHKGSGPAGKAAEGGNILGNVFEKFVIVMVAYFVISIVNSFAQNYHKRIHKKKKLAKD